MSRRTKCSLLLLLTAFIWGSATVAQSTGMDYVQPFTYITVRNILAALTLLSVLFVSGRKKNRRQKETFSRGETQKLAGRLQEKSKKYTILGGICCGVALTVAGGFQQVGISMTTAGKTGFITSLYIVMVPLFGLFLGKRVPVRVWFCVAMAVFGFYLLCAKEKLTISFGDGMVLICAVCFAIHILIIDYFTAKNADPIRMSCLQFLVVAVLSAVLMFLFEKPALAAIWEARYPILYAGVLSSGVGFTLQAVAQVDVDPTMATLLMSLESVFAVLSGCLLLQEVITLREFLGCVVVFTAILLVQLPAGKKKKRRKQESGTRK